MTVRRLAALLLATALPGAAAQAGGGMWLPSQAPEVARQLRETGFQLDPAALANLSAAPMNAIVSLGGCSASFVSPQGLIATNHHCVYGSIQYNSAPGRDLMKDGLMAATLADELPAAPGTRAFVIEDLRDVTREMMRGVSDRMSGLARTNRLDANRKALIAACERQPNRRCDVRAYFGGAQYWLQQQLEIQDVRLVYAPAGAIGNYGGEIDNWQWPRHTGDFAFYRAYVAPDGSSRPFDKANVPYQSRSWLRVAREGLAEGDFVLVAGFPGVTERFRTAAETRAWYERIYPRQQQLLADYSDRIMQLTAGDEAATIKYANTLRGSDNFKKKLLGQMAGAEAIGLIDKKAAQEAAFRQWALAPERAARLRPVIDSLDRVAAEEAEADLTGATAGVLNRAQLLAAARTLYRWAKEREKPDAEREFGFQERDRRLIAERLTAIERRYDPRVDRGLFEQALGEYARLPEKDRSKALAAALADGGLDRLYAGTRLGDTAERLAWMDRPASAFETSDDPFIRLAVAMYPEDIAAENARKDRQGRMQQARSAYLAAWREWAASRGEATYPDANGSLRFTFGKVAGKARDGMRWDAFTTDLGILEKATGREPFDAPERQLAALRNQARFAGLARPDGRLPVNYLSTVDITNGNSGSATLNARGELVGLAFDGTIEGVISDWWFDDALTRTIHVDSRYMIWTMEQDGAQRLLSEMQVMRPAISQPVGR